MRILSRIILYFMWVVFSVIGLALLNRVSVFVIKYALDNWIVIESKEQISQIAIIISIVKIIVTILYMFSFLYYGFRWITKHTQKREKKIIFKKKRRRIEINFAQRIIIGIVVSVITLILGFGFMSIIDINPDDLEDSWGGWFILIILIGVFEIFWFRNKKIESSEQG